jgi:hypothetical protein
VALQDEAPGEKLSAEKEDWHLRAGDYMVWSKDFKRRSDDSSYQQHSSCQICSNLSVR